jgi:TolB-like protein/antitoxin component YwqK of YwqJK toxin-antitoxin module
MKALIFISALVTLSLVTGCSSNPSNSLGSNPKTVTKDQVEQKRVKIFYEKGSDEPYTGTVTEHYRSGELESSMKIEKGQPVGLMERWYRSGQKQSEAELDGTQSGRIAEWYENGQLKTEAELLNGRPHGHGTSWYPNGQMKSEADNLVDGRPGDGTATQWYESGQKKSVELRVSGRMQCSTQWDEMGGLQSSSGRGCEGSTADALPTSIAVLPFVNMSRSSDGEALADGVAESIILALESHGVNVAPRDKSFAFKGADTDLREIGSSLGATHLLEGSVRTAGDKIRITAQLIEPSNGFHVWSETYDRTLTDLAAVQQEIVNNVISAIAAQKGSDHE